LAGAKAFFFRAGDALALAAAAVVIAEKLAARFMNRSRIRIVQRRPEGDW